MEAPNECNNSDEYNEDEDEYEAEPKTLLEKLKEIEEIHSISLAEILLCGQQNMNDNNNEYGINNNTIPSLQIQCIISIFKDCLKNDDIESFTEEYVEETIKHLLHIMQHVYMLQKDQQSNNESLSWNEMGITVIQKAISKYAEYIHAHRFMTLDGCANILESPNTSGQITPDAIKLQLQHFLSTMKRHLFKFHWGSQSDGPLPTIEEIKENYDGGDHTTADIISHFMGRIVDKFSIEECMKAFLPESFNFVSGSSSDGNDNDFEFIQNYALSENSICHVQVCAYAGVLGSLRDYQKYQRYQNTKKKQEEEAKEGETDEDFLKGERDDEGHLIYEVDDDMDSDDDLGYYGRYTSTNDRNNSNKVTNNDFFYGVRLGTILHFAADYVKTVQNMNATELPKHLNPFAKFHYEVPRDITYPSDNVNDIKICRAVRDEIYHDAFDIPHDVYSSHSIHCDGSIGFTHVGGGWKCREFCGFAYAFDVQGGGGGCGFVAQQFKHEFWDTPNCILSDGPNDTTWISSDKRIKGFTLNRDLQQKFYTKYIFNFEDISEKKSQIISTSTGTESRKKRSRLLLDENETKHGKKSLISFGNRLGYLQNGYIQVWRLHEDNIHDGIRRMVSMSNINEDIAAFSPEDIIDYSNSTWMDDLGYAEVTRGKSPDSIRHVGILTPDCIGYLKDETFAFSNYHGRREIHIYNQELHKISCLVGLSNGINIVQRPSFDQSLFVASDKNCVKVFDLRTGKAEITIAQKCEHSSPMLIDGHESTFLCNKLDSKSGGTMIWDLREQKPLYSLPVNESVALIPKIERMNGSPLLFSASGEVYKYGSEIYSDDDFKRAKEQADWKWSSIQSNSAKADACVII